MYRLLYHVLTSEFYPQTIFKFCVVLAISSNCYAPCEIRTNYICILAYFPGVARVFIYPSLIVICVPSLADNLYAPWRYITHTSADQHTVTSSH
jgi:hypothetical protein